MDDFEGPNGRVLRDRTSETVAQSGRPHGLGSDVSGAEWVWPRATSIDGERGVEERAWACAAIKPRATRVGRGQSRDTLRQRPRAA